ncbi:MAG: type I methionyl aminopeptidase [Candidatus Moranbacteria bacterium]|nr:type I methionyl aminopeptidase [Candidatus Moranbacteria bacterium]NTW75655.1 type I methionyl aminopeptidase [Candidatus Moranbacteria bacterium]
MNELIKTDSELENIRESGARLAMVMEELLSAAIPGVSTALIGDMAEERIRKQGGIPIFKGYGAEWGKPFPAAVCVSINDEVVHGIPSPGRILQEGDLLKLDLGMLFQGMVSDMARTKAIGTVSAEAARLLSVTRESLDCGIAKIRSGARLSDFARAVDRRVRQDSFSVVRDLVGHGVGRELHEEPQIPNYFDGSVPDFSFRKGMTVALEPMVNAGGHAIRLAKDGWTYVTRDGSLSAHFEDTVIVTERGAEIVTRLSNRS